MKWIIVFCRVLTVVAGAVIGLLGAMFGLSKGFTILLILLAGLLLLGVQYLAVRSGEAPDA